MSASDAAPLPRLGEVFFDVRGNSRSMRLSWYADTGVAVLSIWQGGMCTGTFRLAIADLPRMVETLQRGPGGQRREWDPEPPGEVFAQVPRVAATAQGQAMEPPPGQLRPDRGAEQAEYRTESAQHQTARHPAARHEATQYLTEPPGGAPTRTAGYPAGPPGHRAAAAPGPHPVAPEYLAELPDDPRTGAMSHLAAPPGYPPAPPDRIPPPPDQPTTPPGHAARLPDPLTGPAPDLLAGPAGHQVPPDQRTEYLSATGPAAAAGYDSAPGAGGPPGSGYPPAGASGPYPRGTGHDALADDPYPGGTGPADYPGSHYPPGTSAPGHGDVGGQADTDYPAHYGSTVTDDILPGPAPDSTPYDRPRGPRRAANRHAAPDAPFD